MSAPALSVDAVIERGDYRLEAAFACAGPATAVFGPSGAGKTTLLHAIAGLVRPSSGELRLGGDVLFSSRQGIDLPPERRRVGMVFQDGLLFPHMRVKANLLYGRRGDGGPGLARVVDLLEIGPLLERRPASLSGGERRRVALGRALLSSPRVLLLDEPLEGLDQSLRNRILPYLRRVRDELGVPLLYVSHSLTEIAEITDQIVVIDGGRVRASGHLLEVLRDPPVLALAEASGLENVLSARVEAHEPARGLTRVTVAGQTVKVPLCEHPPGTELLVGIRAQDVILARAVPGGISARNHLEATVRDVSRVKERVLVELDLGEGMVVEITPDAQEELAFAEGERLIALIKTHAVRVGPRTR